MCKQRLCCEGTLCPGTAWGVRCVYVCIGKEAGSSKTSRHGHLRPSRRPTRRTVLSNKVATSHMWQHPFKFIKIKYNLKFRSSVASPHLKCSKATEAKGHRIGQYISRIAGNSIRWSYSRTQKEPLLLSSVKTGGLHCNHLGETKDCAQLIPNRERVGKCKDLFSRAGSWGEH